MSLKLRHIIAVGKLMKLKRKYRSAAARNDAAFAEMDAIGLQASAQIDWDELNSQIANLSNMNPEAAAEAAADAVFEAEAAVALVEEAEQKAEAAEAEAEFAEAEAEAEAAEADTDAVRWSLRISRKRRKSPRVA